MITGERRIGAGTRRVEALTGDGADAHLRLTIDHGLALIPRIAELEKEVRDLRRQSQAKAGGGLPKASEIAAQAREVRSGVKFASTSAAFESPEQWKGFAKEIRSSLPSGVIAVAFANESPQIFVTVSPDLVAQGISAGELVKAAMGPLAGKGGGRPEMAQGMGTRPDGIGPALALIAARLGATGQSTES